jgi:murein DD-endopeptidase MepM/ murein hydrolase activator NlpD
VKDGFLIKIIPPAGSAIYRIHFRRSQVACVVAVLLVLASGLLGVHFWQLHTAAADISRLRAEGLDEQRKLDAMERQAAALQKLNSDSAQTIESIRRALGDEKASAAARSGRVHASLEHERASVATLALRLRRLERAEAETHAQARRLSHLASRVLNIRHLASIARARMLAAIPSLNPVDGAINAAFGYRTDPFPEFHKGLDLAADYGTLVHSAAAGTVAAAGWEGGFGIKIDIDHGNGYHTWYCHLSRLAVTPGQVVARGQTIGTSGSTGESTGPHLHYQVMLDGVAIDPMPYLSGVPAKVLATLHGDSRVQ